QFSRCHFLTYALADFREFEHAGDEVHVVDVLWRERKLLRGGHPAHAHIVGILASEVEHAPAFDLQFTKSKTLTDQQRDQQRDSGLAVAGRSGERIDKPALQPTHDEIIGWLESRDKFRAR